VIYLVAEHRLSVQTDPPRLVEGDSALDQKHFKASKKGVGNSQSHCMKRPENVFMVAVSAFHAGKSPAT